LKEGEPHWQAAQKEHEQQLGQDRAASIRASLHEAVRSG
jgi:hypothetical protein